MPVCKANLAPLNKDKISGGNNEKETPVPIPNTAVKLLSADDTWLETARENRSLPELYQGPVLIWHRAFVMGKGRMGRLALFMSYLRHVRSSFLYEYSFELLGTFIRRLNPHLR